MQADEGWWAFFEKLEQDDRENGRSAAISAATRNQVLLDAHGRCMFDGCGADLTGREAEAANGLRDGFDQGLVTAGKLTKKETTLYTGRHSIECFIVKAGYLAARSGQLIVNIQ